MATKHFLHFLIEKTPGGHQKKFAISNPKNA
jgi:hypothetical protein